MALLDVSLQRGAMDGIGPIASPSPDGRSNRRKMGHTGRRLNGAQAALDPIPRLRTYGYGRGTYSRLAEIPDIDRQEDTLALTLCMMSA
jgi:hypothetical protein